MMKTFIFTNRETHSAFEFLSEDQDRLQAILDGCTDRGRIRPEQITDSFEDWGINERPTELGSFYDQLLETILLHVDFENLVEAISMLRTGTLSPEQEFEQVSHSTN